MSTATKPKRLSWTPKQRGDVYCAPACGLGCKKTWHEAAVHGAKKLAQRMGPGWEPHVWENLGWHYSVRKGGVKIHPFIFQGKLDSYTAFLGEEGEAGGWWAESGKTPEAALKKVIKIARAEIDLKTARLEAAEADIAR